MKYEIYKNGDWFVVNDASGHTVWVEKTLEKCQEAINSGIIDRSLDMCKEMCR